MQPYRDVVEPPPSPKHWRCEACRAWVEPTLPHWGWRAAEVGFWLSTPLALVVLKGLGVVAMPFLLLFAGGLAGPLRSMAVVEPKCPTCRRYLTRPTPALTSVAGGD